MPETNSPMAEYVFHDGFHSVGPPSLKISRILTTSLVGLMVVDIWHRAGWEIAGLISRFLAVVLLADVLLSPALISWREKRLGKSVKSSVFAEMGYGWLMTMAMLIMISRIH